MNPGLFQGITCLTVFWLKLGANGSIFWLYSMLNWIPLFHLILSIQKIPRLFMTLLINPHVIKWKKSVTTDLKNEYREIISILGFKHQFYHFHTKQMINRNIQDYIKENKSDEDDIKLINSYKSLIFEILRHVLLGNWLEVMAEPVETSPSHSFYALQAGKSVTVK